MPVFTDHATMAALEEAAARLANVQLTDDAAAMVVFNQIDDNGGLGGARFGERSLAARPLTRNEEPRLTLTLTLTRLPLPLPQAAASC